MDILGLGILLDFQDNASSRMQNANRIFGQMYQTSEDLTVAIEQNVRVFQRLGVVSMELKGLGSIFKSMGDSVLGVLGKSIEETKTFETELTRLRLVSGATKEELAEFRRVGIETGINTAFSPQEAIQGMSELKSAGLDNIGMLKSLDATLNMVAVSAGSMDLSTGASVLASTLNKFNLKATEENAKHITDVFTEAANWSNLELADFPAFINALGSSPSKTNVPLEEFVALGGLLKNVGQESAQAGSTVAGFARQVITLSRQLENGAQSKLGGMKLSYLEAMGIDKSTFWDDAGKMRSMTDIFEAFMKGSNNLNQADKTIAFQTLFGDQASDVMYAVENASKGYLELDKATGKYIETTKDGKASLSEIVKGLKEVGPVAEENAQYMLGTAQGIEKLWEGSKQTFQILLGQTVLPIVGKFIQVLTSALNKLILFGDEHPRFMKVLGYGIGITGLLLTAIGAFLLFGGAIFGIISVTGLLVSKFQLLCVKLGFARNGMLTMGGIAKGLIGKLFGLMLPLLKLIAVSGAFYLAWKYDFLGVRTFVEDTMSGISRAFSESKQIVSMSTQDMIKSINDLSNSSDYFDRLTASISKVRLIFGALGDAWSDNTISDDSFNQLSELGLLDVVGNILDIKFKFEEMFKGIESGFSSVMKWFGNFGSSLKDIGVELDPIINGIKDLLGITADAGTPEAWNQIGEAIGKIAGALVIFIVVIKVIGFIISVGSAIAGVFQFVISLIGVIGSAIGFIGSLFSAIAGVIGTVLTVIGAIVGLPAWVVGLIIAGVVAFIAAIVIYWDQIVNFFAQCGAGICQFFDEAWQNISKFASDSWANVTTFASDSWEKIKGVWDGVTGFFSGVWDGITDGASKLFSWLEEKFSWVTGVIDNVKGGIQNGWDSVTGWVTGNDKGSNSDSKGKNEKIVGMATGGFVTTTGIGLLHPNEVVVNDDITSRLDAFLTKEQANGIASYNNTSSTKSYDNSINFGQGSIQIISSGNADYDVEELARRISDIIQRDRQINSEMAFGS